MDPVSWCAVAVLCGLALAPELGPPLPWGAVAVGLGAALARWRLGCLPLAGLALGAVLGRSLPEGPALRGPVAVQGTVAAAPTGRIADLAVWACAEGVQGFTPCRGRVRVVFPTPPPPGSQWVVAGEAAAPAPWGLPGGPDAARSASLARVRAVLRARQVARLGGEVPLAPPVEGPRGVLRALAVGDVRGVDEPTLAILRGTGTSHLLSVSGFHVGVAAGGVGGVVGFVLRRGAWIRPRGVSSAWAWWAGAVTALVYTALVGAPVSAQRAGLVAALAAVGRSLGRGIEPLRLLGLAAVAVCAVDPSALASPSFQLSFGAVAGLIRFGGPLDRAVRRWAPWGLGWVGSSGAVTVAATLGTLPAAAWWFQSLPPSSALANLIAIPWTTALAPLAACDAFAPERLAGPCGWLGGLGMQGLIAALGWLCTDPWAPAVGPWGALFLCLMFVRPRAGFVGAVLLLGLGLRARPAGGLEVQFLDVGQGDAALVDFPDGRRWLVDGGRRDEVLRALRRQGVRTLDAVIASHSDADHAEGLLPVLEQLRVRALVVGPAAGHAALREVARARGIPVIVHPTRLGLGTNDGSVVVRADSPWGGVLFAGDLHAAGEASYGTPSAVLKVAHHGAATSSSPAFLDRVQPELAVISVGPNRYRHPSPSVEARLRARGIRTLRTDLDGTVRVRLDPTGLWTETGGRWVQIRGPTP